MNSKEASKLNKELTKDGYQVSTLESRSGGKLTGYYLMFRNSADELTFIRSKESYERFRNA